MGQAYDTRASTLNDGNVITAALFNNEFNKILNAFAYASSGLATGHQHDGTAGEGGNIHTIGDQDFLNKIVIESDEIKFFIEVGGAAVEQLNLVDGILAPETTNDVDLGTNSKRFKTIYATTLDVGTTLTNAQLANSTVSYGGVSLALGASDATPAFNLSDATAYPAANLTGTIAGIQIAAGAVTESRLADNAVTNAKVADNAIGTAELASNVVTTAKIADQQITGAKIAASTIGSGNMGTASVPATALQPNAVTNNKIADDAVTTAKIATTSVTESRIADDAVTTTKIADNAIITSHIFNQQITGVKIAASTIGSGNMADSAIVTAKIADDAVTEAKLENSINSAIAANTAKVTNATHTGDVTGATALTIADNAVTNAKIADLAVNTDQIADDAITTAKLANQINSIIAANTAKVTNATHTGDVTGSTALTITDGAVATAKIADDAVTEAKLANAINTAIAANTAKVSNATHTGEVTGATALTIADDAVTNAKIADDAVDTAQLTDSAVTGAKITNNTITGLKLALNSITNGSLSDGTVQGGKLSKPVTLDDYRINNTDSTLIINNINSGTHGRAIDFKTLGGFKGSIGNSVILYGDAVFMASYGAGIMSATQQGTYHAVVPCTSIGQFFDNSVDLGTLSSRWDDVYATNGTIQTSDRNEKQNIEELSDAERRVAVAAKGLLRKFKWKDAVEEKGDNARTHFGIIAQDLEAAFTAEGLDAGDYAMFISNTWWEHTVEIPAVAAVEAQEAVYDENGILVTAPVKGSPASEAYTKVDCYKTEEEAPEGAVHKTRRGVRYSELLAFIIAAL